MNDVTAKAAPFAATAHVPTASGSKYLQQLSKHWSHSLVVTFTADHASIIFPRNARGADYPGDAVISLNAHDAELAVMIEASTAAQRDQIKVTVASHLDRFAFREAPLSFDWRDA